LKNEARHTVYSSTNFQEYYDGNRPTIRKSKKQTKMLVCTYIRMSTMKLK
jgi:hypothetical protein